MTDAELARHLAQAAGQMLLDLRSGPAEGKALGAEGDRISNAFLVAELRRLRPDDAILSEEEAPDLARLQYRRVWLVDPLDGTREYGERRDDWAVHVALSIDGRIADGAVAQPALNQTICTQHPPALHAEAAPLRIVVSRSRPAACADALAARIGCELVPMGSAGAKTLAVLRGEADVYLHQGDMHEWDSGAPAAVAQAAGLWVSRVDGSPLVFNQPRPLTPDILICHQARAPALLAAIAPLLG
ncbi:3'(2'),5'-bisphosphate nucleotidase CysQ [Sandarakinorhabdus sp. AAP62]|uniref:3'(2'),5'-bisphosphate nucleotidase CysQ n=1 Tax=Sandarakinorhabdus sp. AAP62 TaxID=1248916 RepID=UPI0002DCF786|nr:3'(2'),5'-bisphosphate nucleotidase CysQ [Sandarakinorhabdus sp. AAP62]